MKRILFAVVMMTHLFCTVTACAQEQRTFVMEKSGGHFYLNTTLNGVEARMMLESGVPGLMMSRTFYESNKDKMLLNLKPCEEKIRYSHGTYDIVFKAHGQLSVGDAAFEGTVMIADGEHELLIPFNMLRHTKDDKGAVYLDLTNNMMRVISGKELDKVSENANGMDLSFNKFGMPVVNTMLTMDVNGSHVDVTGNFIVDMGNGSLLFINKCEKKVAAMLTDGNVTLKEARDMNGNVVAEGLFADKLTICGRTFDDVSVGVRQFKSIDDCGFLGVKFFTGPVVFDFNNGRMFLCE